MSGFNQILSEKLTKLGISDFGFAKTEGMDPLASKNFPNAISIVVKLSDAVLDEIDGAPTFSYFHHYRTVNAFIDSVILQTGMLIEAQGYRYIPVAASQSIPANEMPYSGRISHKAVARTAGLGSIGKNALFISNQYGARVRLGTILTDIPLDAANVLENPDICRDCSLCVRACPAMALKGEVWENGMPRDSIIDAQACSDYMKTHFQHIGRGAVCGICVKVCKACRK